MVISFFRSEPITQKPGSYFSGLLSPHRAQNRVYVFTVTAGDPSVVRFTVVFFTTAWYKCPPFHGVQVCAIDSICGAIGIPVSGYPCICVSFRSASLGNAPAPALALLNSIFPNTCSSAFNIFSILFLIVANVFAGHDSLLKQFRLFISGRAGNRTRSAVLVPRRFSGPLVLPHSPTLPKRT